MNRTDEAAVETLEVALGARRYPIHAGAGLTATLREDVARRTAAGGRVAFVVDAGFAAAQPGFVDRIAVEAPRFVVPAGEGSKSFALLEAVSHFLAEIPLTRRDALYAVGGGVVGDLAGFAAAAYLRGIAYVQVPTTLLAMVDSAVGGKTAINLPQGKNLIGAFHQPVAVYADTAVLASLPPREFAAGMAEVIKYGMLGDADFFRRLAEGPLLTAEHPDLPGVITRCCAMKAAIVAEDEQERAASGGRALLNLGHTFGHAIEAVAGYGAYLHGEAVAVGLVLATRLSVERGDLDPAAVAQVEAVLTRYGLPVRLRTPLATGDLLAAMRHDKKAQGDQLRFVTMTALGHAVTVDDVAENTVRALWAEVGAS